MIKGMEHLACEETLKDLALCSLGGGGRNLRGKDDGKYDKRFTKICKVWRI